MGLLLGSALIMCAAAPAIAQSSDEEESGFMQNFSSDEEEDAEKAGGAVYQYDKKYRPVPENYDELDKPRSVIGKGLLVYAVIRVPDGDPGDFILRVATPFPVSGCAEIEDPEIEMTENPPALDLVVKEATAIAKKGIRYAHYECDAGARYAFTDIPMNRDELMENGIKKLTMRNDDGLRYHGLELDVHKEYIEITGKYNAGKFWFYPEGTVMIAAPAVTGKQDVSDDIIRAARAKGLMPLTDVLTDYEPDERIKNSTVYFVDPTGLLTREIKVAGKPVFFGNIKVDKIFNGPQGEYKRPSEMQLYAKIPDQAGE